MALDHPNIDDIYFAALEKAAGGSRAAYLDEVCQGHSELRARVERLLGAQAKVGSFLETPAPGLEDRPTLDQPVAERPGAPIGPYKLLQEIGHGGMGVVFLAEQLEPVRRKVALKIIKPGMDTRQVIARFEAERQALSLMDHPNIARVLDAGTTGPDSGCPGRPFFVMELVKGQPITEYCDEHHLTPRQRLEMLLPVCRAIQHAHQKGIIHRDIKPSNILVAEYDQRPVPKVIDFGVAKAVHQPLTERTMFTGLGQIVGTLEYMSPEQAKVNQLDVDTRSDVYSLGVVLYELLTGTTPLDRQRLRSAAWDELMRIIREEEPPKPSTRLSDLGRCRPSSETAADQARTPTSLASISALRQTAPTQLTKLVRGELDWIVMKALDKDRNRRYESVSGLAMDVQRYLSDEAVQACPPSFGYRLRKFARRNRRALVATSSALLALLIFAGVLGWTLRDRAARAARVAGQMEQILAEVAQLESEQQWAEGLAAARRAEVLAAESSDPAMIERLRRVLHALEFVAQLEDIRLLKSELPHPAGSRGFDDDSTARRYAAAFREYGVDVEQLSTEVAAERIQAQSGTAAAVAAALDDWAAMLPPDRRSLAQRLSALATLIDPNPWRIRVRQAIATNDQAALQILAASSDLILQAPGSQILVAKSIWSANPERTIAVLEQACDAYPGDFWLHFELALHSGALQKPRLDIALRHYTAARALRPHTSVAWHNLGNVYSRLDEPDKAIALLSHAIELNPRPALTWNSRAATYTNAGQPDKALPDFEQAIQRDPHDGVIWFNRGNTYFLLGQTDLAIADYSQAIKLAPQFAAAWRARGNCQERLGRHREALDDLNLAIELDPSDAVARQSRGGLYHRLNQLEPAQLDYTAAIELEPTVAKHWYNRANLYSQLQRVDLALTDYAKAIELDATFAEAHCNLGLLLQREGRFAEALVWQQRGHDLGSQQTNWNYPSAQWVRQCQRWMDREARLPAALAGELALSDPELVEFGHLCTLKKQYATAAGFFQRVYLHPKPDGVHWQGIRVAALAGSGQGDDRDNLNEADRARWRQQALSWLQDDLAIWKNQLTNSAPSSQSAARQNLQTWRDHPDLSGVRDERAIENLPEAERQAWRALWAEVAELLNRGVAQP